MRIVINVGAPPQNNIHCEHFIPFTEMHQWLGPLWIKPITKIDVPVHLLAACMYAKHVCMVAKLVCMYAELVCMYVCIPSLYVCFPNLYVCLGKIILQRRGPIPYENLSVFDV